MKMNDSVKYQLEKAEDALRTALKFADKESVYVISAISKALIEIGNTMFAAAIAERIEAAVKENNVKHEMNNTSFKWDNKTEFVSANPTVSE